MRPVRYNVAASLDGFIAGPHGEYDWIPDDPAVDFGALFARVDTVLLGRHTYELTRREPSAASAWPSVIASRTCAAVPAPPEAITGTFTASATRRVSGRS